LYYHFRSKEEIFDALVDEGIRLLENHHLANEFVTDPLEAVWLRFWTYYEFSKKHPAYFALLFVDPACSRSARKMLERRALSRAETLLTMQRCVDAGIFPEGTNLELAAQVCWCAVHSHSVRSLLRGRRRFAPWDEVAARVLRFAISGIRAGFASEKEEQMASTHPGVHRALSSAK
jgi:AcrR family transcriptional regulator